VEVDSGGTLVVCLNGSSRTLLRENFGLVDPRTLGDSGCFTPQSSVTCNWTTALSSIGGGCGLMNDTTGAYIRCGVSACYHTGSACYFN
jgi:hypothetical protein